jgi:hypothetical protein
MAVTDASAAIDPSTGAPVDPNQKKTEALLSQLGVHPAQLQAQQHLTGLMNGLTSLQGVQSPVAQGQSNPPNDGNVGPQLVPTPKAPVATGTSPAAAPDSSPAAAAPAATATSDTAPVTMPGPTRQMSPMLAKTEAQIGQAQDERDRLVKTGSGISQIHNPFLRGLAHAGEFAETLLVPSAAALTPGTELHHDILMRSAQNQVDKGLAQEQEEEKIPATEASTALEQAKVTAYPGTQEALDAKNDSIAARNNAAAENLKNPTAKTAFQLWAQQHEGKPVEDWLKELAEGKNNKQNDYEQAFSDAVKAGRATNDYAGRLKIAKEWAAAKQAPQRAPQALVIAPSPTTGTPTAQVIRPGTQVPETAQTVQAFSKDNSPTTQQQTAAGRGQTVHEQVPQLKAQINQLSDQIGPLSGRWNEFMQGKVGAPSKEMASLRTNLLFMSSAVALMHAQGRLPENLRQEFDHAINAPQQSAENLQAILDQVDQWTSQSIGTGKSASQKAQERIRNRNNPPPSNTPTTGGQGQYKGQTITIDHAQQIADRNKLTLQQVLDDAKAKGITVK